MQVISKREQKLPKTEFDKILQMAAERKDIISLGPGEPDFSPSKGIIDAAKKALSQGKTHYLPANGLSSLRELIAGKLKKENKIDVDISQIIVTCGSSEAMFLSKIVLIDPTEEVLVPDPGFLSYAPETEILDGVPISFPLKFEDGFQYDVDEIEKLVNEKTKILTINTPSNPTGTVLKKKLLEEIADLAIEKKLMIIADEAYEKFVYEDNKHVSIGSLNGMEDHVITFQTFSKTFAMPGFRIGYAAGPEKVISAMTRSHIYSSICAPSISQYAAIEALKENKKHVEKMRREYERRGRMMFKRVSKMNIFEVKKPEGAFYLFPKISHNMSSMKLMHFLLEKAEVLVVPGNEFGRNGEGFVRMSYATSFEKIEKAMDRIDKSIKKL